MPVYGCKSSCHSCPALHRRTGPLAPRDNHSLAEGHWFFTDYCLLSTALTLSVPRPMGFYPSLQGLPYPYVCYVCLCVSHFSPRRGSGRPGFADVGPKVLIRYYYNSHGAQFLSWRLSLGEDGKSPTY